MTPYETGYNEQLEKLGLAMPGFLKNLGTKAKSMYFGKPNVATAPAGAAPMATSSNYTKAKDLFYNKKDVGFGKGNFGPVDMGSRGAQMDFQKKLMAVPAGTSASGMPLPSGKEMHEKSQQALKQIQDMRAAKGQRPLQSQSREGQKEFSAYNQQQRMKGIMNAHNAPVPTRQSGYFDDWGSVAPTQTTVPPRSGWVNQPGNNMPTMQPSMVNAPTKVGYDQTLTALGIQGTTKQAFLEGVARKAGDAWQKFKGRSPGFVSQRRTILDQAKKKGEKDTLEALKVKKGLKEAPAPTPEPEAPTTAPETPQSSEQEPYEGPTAWEGVKRWWGDRSPVAKAGIGLAAAAPIAYGLHHMGGEPSMPQNIDPVYPNQY
jgi:hypothetical protein